MEGKRGSECLLKSVSNIDFNPEMTLSLNQTLKAALAC
ncbi:Sortase A LPXTG specific [Lactiplantibacillus plantarum]|nr:Sortase A LPXTG specific [Lactiplantibacillus plantarum]